MRDSLLTAQKIMRTLVFKDEGVVDLVWKSGVCITYAKDFMVENS